MVFPWVALFHLLVLVFNIWQSMDLPFPSLYWVDSLLLLLYLIAWLFVCDLRRWAAYAYLALVSINILIRVLSASQTDLAMYTNTFFPLDIVFAFFVLAYFKRFD